MPILRNIIKGREMYFVRSGMNVLDIAKYMSEKHVGAVAVLDKNDNLIGIFSERDLMVNVVAKELNPKSVKVDNVMTKNPLAGSPEESYEECVRKMRQVNSRHLPIVEGGKLVGMVSMRDLLILNIAEKEKEIKVMDAYLEFQTSGKL
jgi:CBS domain-containing protein